VADGQRIDRRSELQEEQDELPYHDLPVLRGRAFSQAQHYGWGYRYLGRLHVVLDLLEAVRFQSLLDLGCGDGRFLREVQQRFPGRDLRGVDVSERAIGWARRMNPHLSFEQRDIVRSPLPAPPDVVTLLDVIEHVAPAALPGFMDAAVAARRPGGTLIITVPHTNMRLAPKHHQHLSSRRRPNRTACAMTRSPSAKVSTPSSRALACSSRRALHVGPCAVQRKSGLTTSCCNRGTHPSKPGKEFLDRGGRAGGARREPAPGASHDAELGTADLRLERVGSPA
jgi:2-polyprenyl-3-methyl-5-hydroxy-6-metoxy-1,4-benzoquinol methylase